MIVLDASVLIAHTVASDAHSAAALEILDTEEDLVIHPMTLAEFLVGPVRVGREEEARATIARLSIERFVPGDSEPLAVARLRASTRLKLPDCCVLAAALSEGATLATFDAHLGEVARSVGVEVVGAV